MKKFLLLILGFCCIVSVTGCGKNEQPTEKKEAKEDKVMTCTRTMEQSGMKMNFEYKVTYQGDTVKVVVSNEQVTSDNAQILTAYKEAVEKVYSPYAGIEYYDYEVTIDGNKLTSLATINYEKIDTDKLIKVDSANAQLIKDGKVSVTDIESVYQSVGASCVK